MSSGHGNIEWRHSATPTGYPEAVEWMEARAAAIREGTAREAVWFLEHPALYTAGTSADPAELITPRFPVFQTGRGGRYTYHGPGQRIVYVLADLSRRNRDVRCYVHALEGWAIDALARLHIDAFRAPGRVGIWTLDQGREAKIGAIGVRVRRWVTLHGMAINRVPALDHFDGIVPCGLPDYPVTSIAALGRDTGAGALDDALIASFPAFLERVGGHCEAA